MNKDLRIEVVGVTKEMYFDSEVIGHNCDFDYEDCVFERVHILVRQNNWEYYITLSMSEGECGSGWCAASWGNIDVTEVGRNRMPMTHKPADKLFLEFRGELANREIDLYKWADGNIPNVETIKTNLFTLSYDGGDSYYPCGGFGIEDDLLESLERAPEQMPIYILVGDSGLGKSWIGYQIRQGGNLQVFETDSVDELPDHLNYEVIILGNRSGWTVEDIKSRLLPDVTKPIIVEFKED